MCEDLNVSGRLTLVLFSFFGFVWSQCAAANEPIALMYAERAPYIVVNENGGISGLTADPSVQAFEEAGVAFSIVEIPTNRQLASIQSNAAPSCGIGWFDRPERRVFAQFTKPIYRDRPTVVLMQRSTALAGYYDSLEKLIANDKLMMLAKTQFSYGQRIDTWIQKYRPRQTLVTLDNVGMVRMLTAKRADYMLMGQEEATHLMKQSDLVDVDDVRTLSFPDSPSGNYRHLMCSLSVPATVIEQLNKVISMYQLP